MIKPDVRKEGKEHLHRLLNDPDRERKMAERDLIRIESGIAARSFFASLERIGVVVDSFDHLMHRYGPFSQEIVDVLLESVRTMKQPQVLDMVIRMFCVTRLRYDGRPLAGVFERVDIDWVKWSIGNSIACSHPTGIDNWIIEALSERKHGYTRQMLCIAAGRMHLKRAPEILMQVFDEMPAHASMGLRLCGGGRELEFMRNKLASEETWYEWECRKVETSIHWIERKLNRRIRKNVERDDNSGC